MHDVVQFTLEALFCGSFSIHTSCISDTYNLSLCIALNLSHAPFLLFIDLFLFFICLTKWSGNATEIHWHCSTSLLGALFLKSCHDCVPLFLCHVLLSCTVITVVFTTYVWLTQLYFWNFIFLGIKKRAAGMSSCGSVWRTCEVWIEGKVVMTFYRQAPGVFFLHLKCYKSAVLL